MFKNVIITVQIEVPQQSAAPPSREAWVQAIQQSLPVRFKDATVKVVQVSADEIELVERVKRVVL